MGHDKGVHYSCSHLLPRQKFPELDIVESEENKAQSICLQCLPQLEASGAAMPLLVCDPEAIIPEFMNRCHLYVFLFQCNLCSANGTRTPRGQTQPHYTLDDLMSMGWMHAIAKER